MQTATETRRTDWIVNAADPSLVYRIWQEFDGRRWFQRHEWKRSDGPIHLEAWIDGASGWCRDAQPVSAA